MGMATLVNLMLLLDVCKSLSVGWALAIAWKSTIDWEGCMWIALVSKWDRASATGLPCPAMWRMSVVNWEIKSKWRTWRGEWWSGLELKLWVNGLWSVNIGNVWDDGLHCRLPAAHGQMCCSAVLLGIVSWRNRREDTTAHLDTVEVQLPLPHQMHPSWY